MERSVCLNLSFKSTQNHQDTLHHKHNSVIYMTNLKIIWCVFSQLRKWQQHMQEQLKAHQLEELLRLQEEQQRLLGMMNGSEHCEGGRKDT